MRKILYIFLAALCVACSNDNEESFDPSIPDGMGLMRFNVDVASKVEATTTTRAYAMFMFPEELIPSEDDLKLEIYQVGYDEEQNKLLTLFKEYASLTEYNDAVEEDKEPSDDPNDMLKKSPYLPAGDYFARVSNDVDISVESFTNAYFADSTEFTIVARDTERSTKLDIMLQNSVISIEVTDNFNKYFTGGATLKLTTESGNGITLDLPLKDGYEEQFLYVQPYAVLYLEGSAIKQDPGTGIAPTVKFPKSVIGRAIKSKLNCVVVDAASAGSASINVTLDDKITKINGKTFNLHD